MKPRKRQSIFEKAKSRRQFLMEAPGQIEAIRRDIVNLVSSLEQIKQDSIELDRRIHSIESTEPGFIDSLTDQICKNALVLSKLNYGLSGQQTLWGDPSRLHVSPLASVQTCFFNTNSGEIYIDDYTFAGSRVNILAGSHDQHLTGFLRRDAEITEGCDIRIGKGVWLASGSTLLGPCTVGDNAVIAAGAVVTPGSEIPANTVFGGVPAKLIRKLEFSEKSEPFSSALMNALNRNGGRLFIDGWAPKEPGYLPVPGYWLNAPKGYVLTARKEWQLQYFWADTPGGFVSITGTAGKMDVELTAKTGSLSISLPCKGKEPEEIVFELLQSNGKLMLALNQPEESKEDLSYE